MWFLEYLAADLGIKKDTTHFTFMSDKQKCLTIVIEFLFPIVEHIFCVVHLHNIMKVHHGVLALKQLLWKAAKATRLVAFQEIMSEIESKDNGAFTWLDNKPVENWSKFHFRTNVKSDLCVNNISESFNEMHWNLGANQL